MNEGAPVCEVCGREIGRAEAMMGARQGRLVCNAVDCRALVAQLARMPREARAPHLATHARLIRERRARHERNERHVALIRQAEALEDERILRAALRDRGTEGKVVALPLPSGLSEVVPVPAERRERYRRHVERTIEEAHTATPGGVTRDRTHAARKRAHDSEAFLAARPRLNERCEQACGMCKGGCCTTGGDHAFLSPVTLRRLMDADPSLTEARIVETFLSHVPRESIRGACINQTATGCALPRAWRSDVCNAYFCDALKAFQGGWDEPDPPVAVLMIRRTHTSVNRFVAEGANPVVEVAWVDENGPRVLDGLTESSNIDR